MKRQELFDLLMEAAKKIYTRVDVAAGDFRGGTCRVREEYFLFLNRASGLDTNIRILANSLSRQEADNLYLLPKVREVIQQYSDE